MVYDSARDKSPKVRPLAPRRMIAPKLTPSGLYPPVTTVPKADRRTPKVPAERRELANTKGNAETPHIGKAAREKIVKLFRENPKPEWKVLEEITSAVGSKSKQYTAKHLRGAGAR